MPEKKIGRHLQTCHKDESEIKILPGLDNKERQKKLDHLRILGDFHRNMVVLRTGGELIVWRRPDKDAIINVNDYVPCKFCLAFLLKSDLWKHVQGCPFKGESVDEKNLITQAQLLLYSNKYAQGASQELKELVLESMVRDEITSVVKEDDLICTYGSSMLMSSGIKRSHEISQRMRISARLLLALRAETNKNHFSLMDFVDTDYFDTFIKCTRILAGFSLVNGDGENITSFATPSLALKIGYTLDKCLSLVRGISIRRKDERLQKIASDFAELFKLEWVSQISSICLKTMDTNKFNKVTLLPITEDVLKVRAFLKEEIVSTTGKLQQNPCVENWRNLAELVGTRLTIFNRRRGNEVYQMLIVKFCNRNERTNAEIKEIRSSLTGLEKRLIKR